MAKVVATKEEARSRLRQLQEERAMLQKKAEEKRAVQQRKEKLEFEKQLQKSPHFLRHVSVERQVFEKALNHGGLNSIRKFVGGNFSSC